MAKLKMEFRVTWKGTKEAELFYLLDGGVVVPLAGKETVGKGEIIVGYLADDTGVHLIEWGLTFPGRKLGGFVATASISGGDAQDLASQEDDQQDKWVESGKAVG